MSESLTRRDFVAAALASGAALSVLGSSGASAQEASRTAASAGGVPGHERPNVLCILADDLGYGDLSCYGRPDYKTPVLDRLATQGLKFTSNYAAAPVCTPTRCGFITGRYPQRLAVGLEEPLTRRSPQVGLPPGHATIGTQLQAAGYATALIGKWHLGWQPEFNPVRHGFDEFFGMLSGAVDYFTHAAADRAQTEGGAPAPDLWENETPVERSGYLTDLLTNRAIDYLSRKHDKPFFLSLQYNAPHSPWEGPGDAGLDHTDHGGGPMAAGGSPAAYAAIMQSLDSNIGRVLAALKRAGLERDTLVVFTSDNGGERYSYNWPFSGEKFGLNEGGTRVPAIARWPGVTPCERGDRSSSHHDGLDRDVPRGRGCDARFRVSARRRVIAARAARRSRRARARPVLAHAHERGGANRSVEISARRDGRALVRSRGRSRREGGAQSEARRRARAREGPLRPVGRQHVASPNLGGVHGHRSDHAR